LDPGDGGTEKDITQRRNTAKVTVDREKKRSQAREKEKKNPLPASREKKSERGNLGPDITQPRKSESDKKTQRGERRGKKRR